MREVRLFSAVLSLLTAGLLWAGPAVAQPPAKLTDHITDSTGVLTDSGRAAVNSAIDRLYRDRHIQLWVVYVDNFSRFKPENWADRTRSASGMGDHDALLAVATNTKLYAFSAPQAQGLTPAKLNSLRSNQIEPVLGAKDWSGAAVAAADGLDKSTTSSQPASSSKPIWVPIAIGVIVVLVVLVLLLLLFRARRRRRAKASGGPVAIDGRDHSVQQALSTADTRLRQISDYVARHHTNIGSEAQARLDEAKRHLAAARGKESTSDAEAIAYANRASTLAAQAQTLANADVVAAHRTPRRRGNTSKR
jgi:MYXO-CTERM domain-containing protein